MLDFPGEEAKRVRVIQGAGIERTHNLGSSGIVNCRTGEIMHTSLYTHMGIGPGCDQGESQGPRSRWRPGTVGPRGRKSRRPARGALLLGLSLQAQFLEFPPSNTPYNGPRGRHGATLELGAMTDSKIWSSLGAFDPHF